MQELMRRLEDRVGSGRLDLAETVVAISRIPYGRPTDRTADGVLSEWRGTCSTKHMLLAALVRERWPEIEAQLWHRPYRVTPTLAIERWGRAVAASVPPNGLVDVHTYATLTTDGSTLVVDVTFPLSGWDGKTDVPLACGPGPDHPAGDEPLRSKARLVAQSCDPSVREPFIGALAATMTARPRSEAHIRVGGGRCLAYAEWGDPGGRPVVLLHGAPGSRRFCPDAAATAEAGVRLVTFDRPGFGGSERLEGRALLDTPRDVAALADRLGIDRFAVVGVSAGGPHALACAHALGERVRGTGVVSMPGPLDEVPGAWDALPAHMQPTAAAARRAPDRAARAVARYMQRWVDDPATFLRGGPAADRAVLSDPAHRELLVADVTEALRPGAWGMADDLVAFWRPWGFATAGLPAGVRAWCGAQDTRALPDFRYLAATLRGVRAVTWPEVGHFGVLRHWGEVLAAVGPR